MKKLFEFIGRVGMIPIFELQLIILNIKSSIIKYRLKKLK